MRTLYEVQPGGKTMWYPKSLKWLDTTKKEYVHCSRECKCDVIRYKCIGPGMHKVTTADQIPGAEYDPKQPEGLEVLHFTCLQGVAPICRSGPQVSNTHIPHESHISPNRIYCTRPSQDTLESIRGDPDRAHEYIINELTDPEHWGWAYGVPCRLAESEPVAEATQRPHQHPGSARRGDLYRKTWDSALGHDVAPLQFVFRGTILSKPLKPHKRSTWEVTCLPQNLRLDELYVFVGLELPIAGQRRMGVFQSTFDWSMLHPGWEAPRDEYYYSGNSTLRYLRAPERVALWTAQVNQLPPIEY